MQAIQGCLLGTTETAGPQHTAAKWWDGLGRLCCYTACTAGCSTVVRPGRQPPFWATWPACEHPLRPVAGPCAHPRCPRSCTSQPGACGGAPLHSRCVVAGGGTSAAACKASSLAAMLISHHCASDSPYRLLQQPATVWVPARRLQQCQLPAPPAQHTAAPPAPPATAATAAGTRRKSTT